MASPAAQHRGQRVSVRCGHCRRVLGSVPILADGTADLAGAFRSVRSSAGGPVEDTVFEADNLTATRWKYRCRCGKEHPVRAAKLAAAAGEAATSRRREVVLPFDLD